ncbi:MAG: ferrous iron transporter B [Ignavibacteriales bacterium]|nr:MAG: ferrous iron transporter B [Ignavibacteriales bacterium]
MMNPNEQIIKEANKLRYAIGENIHDSVISSIYQEANSIASNAIALDRKKHAAILDSKIDRLVTSKVWGFVIMFLILALVFWLTVVGTNIPSGMLAVLLVDTIHPLLKSLAVNAGFPWWLSGILIDGAYLSLAWVISVMLPPMAIFFPLFTFLEDLGYLPRVAFNLDALFRRAGAHGKQALTMSMGFGCNAAGVVAARIIDSPRERIVAIITNNFSLCNGRWPTQILIASIFIGALVPPVYSGIATAGAVIAVALFGIFLSLVVSRGLSNTVLKGEPSSFSLELPPYRKPRILQILYTSLIDRTLFVLWRAMIFAAPAGVLIWLTGNINIGELSIAQHFITWVDPYALFFGLNGVIILAYIIAIPANEIVVPTILMLTVHVLGLENLGSGAGVMFEADSVSLTAEILSAGGWTALTGISLMLFSLLHNPCSTTIYTIYKETGSIKWTALATFIPLIMGFIICFLVAQGYYLLIN